MKAKPQMISRVAMTDEGSPVTWLAYHPNKRQRRFFRSAIRRARIFVAMGHTNEYPIAEEVYATQLLRQIMGRNYAACLRASPDTMGLHPTVADAETGCRPYVDPANPSRPLSPTDLRYPHITIQPKAERQERTRSMIGQLKYQSRHGLAAIPLDVLRMVAMGNVFTYIPWVRPGRRPYFNQRDGSLANVRAVLSLGFVTPNHLVVPLAQGSANVLKKAIEHHTLQVGSQWEYWTDKFTAEGRWIGDYHNVWMLHLPKDYVWGSEVTKLAYMKPENLMRGLFSVAPKERIMALLDDRDRVEVERKLGRTRTALTILDNNAEEWKGKPRALQDHWEYLYSTDAEGHNGYDAVPFTSCMRDKKAPAAYGLPGNGIGLAYATDANGQLVARTIIRLWRYGSPTKEYIRIFGSDNAPLSTLLQQQGFKRGDLNGVQIAALPTGYRDDYFVPYLDNESSYVKLDDFAGVFTIGMDGVDAQNSSGVLSYHVTECGCCGDDMSRSDGETGLDGTEYCFSCVDDGRVVEVCTRRGGTDWAPAESDEVVYCDATEQYYYEDALEYYDLARCAISGEVEPIDDLVSVQMHGEQTWVSPGRRTVVELAHADPEGNMHGVVHAGARLCANGDWEHEDNVVQCIITRGWYYEEDDDIIQLATIGRKEVWVSVEALRNNPSEFVLCGKFNRYCLLPKGFYGTPLAEMLTHAEEHGVTAWDEVDICNMRHGDFFEAIEPLIKENANV